MLTQPSTRILAFGILLCSLLLAGCLDSSLTFQIRFNEINGLHQNSRVLFDANHIGDVTKVQYTDKGDYLVDVKIKSDFTNAVTEDSTFHIGQDPAGAQARAVIVQQSKPGGKVIAKGTIISGTSKPGYFDDLLKDLRERTDSAETEFRKSLKQWEESFNSQSQQFNEKLNETLQELSRQFDTIKEEVQNVPNREEVKELEKSIQEFVDDFNNAQKDVQEKLRNEVIPQLKQELEKMREKLKKEGREKELEQIDEEINGVLI